MYSARFGSTYTKIGTIQRLAWPLRKDDMQIREAFHIFEGGMFQENSIETCILSRVKQITSPGWMHETSARRVHWENLEGTGGEGGGRGDWDGEHM